MYMACKNFNGPLLDVRLHHLCRMLKIFPWCLKGMEKVGVKGRGESRRVE